MHASAIFFHEIGLLCKANSPPLQDNIAGSLVRLDKLTQKLKREPELFTQYDQITKKHKESLKERTVDWGLFYLPHKPVVRRAAEGTIVIEVYFASAKPNNNTPSLNEC